MQVCLKAVNEELKLQREKANSKMEKEKMDRKSLSQSGYRK